MKKKLSLLLALVLVFAIALSACSTDEGSEGTEGNEMCIRDSTICGLPRHRAAGGGRSFLEYRKIHLPCKGQETAVLDKSGQNAPLCPTFPCNSTKMCIRDSNSVDYVTNVGDCYGTVTLYSEDFSGPFAKAVQDGVTAATGAYSRGTSMQGLAVCRVYECPSILVELGFVSNPNEYESLASDSYIALEAKGIANGIVAYLRSNGT